MKSPSVVLPDGVCVPRVRHAPRVRGNAWEDVVELSKGYGLTFLPWQENALEAMMGERADGMWAARHAGLSCPRQNGKGSLLEGRALAGLLLFGERMIIHSAHEARTAQIGFQRLKSYFDNYDDLRRKVASIGNAVAREYIRLRNGQEVRFVTRSKSAIRGFSADCLLLDEGQILGDMQWEAILYTVSARPNHQIWLVGTPPLSVEEGVVFHRFRQRGLDGKDHQMAWLEWSAPDGCDLDDPKAWAAANPALGSLISHETVVTERAAASSEGFARERLGMWGAESGRVVFQAAGWESLADVGVAPPPRVTLVVDVGAFRSSATIGVAGEAAGGRILVMCESAAGIGWVARRVAELVASRDIVEVALTPGETRGLAGDLTQAGVEFKQLTTSDVAASCTAFQAAVTGRLVVHIDQPELNTALLNARTRRAGDAETWERELDGVDVSPLAACGAAYHRWGVLNAAPYSLLDSVR